MCSSNCTDTITQPKISFVGVWRIAGIVARDTLRRRLGQVAETLAEWRQRRRYRRYLAAMDDRGLKDIGLSPVEAGSEAGRPFWSPPAIDEAARGRRRRPS